MKNVANEIKIQIDDIENDENVPSDRKIRAAQFKQEIIDVENAPIGSSAIFPMISPLVVIFLFF